MPLNSTNLIIIKISNISIDCSVFLNIYLEGNILYGGYWNIFNFSINPIISYK
jgi:hypothetical protein